MRSRCVWLCLVSLAMLACIPSASSKAQVYTEWAGLYPPEGAFTSLPAALAIGSEGQVYVAFNGDGASSNTHVLKYATNGELLWEGIDDESIEIGDLVIDGDGNLIVVGYGIRVDSLGNDYVTFKFDADGNEQWVRWRDGYPSGDEAYAVDVDEADNIYVAGWRFVVKYDSDGSHAWEVNKGLSYLVQCGSHEDVYVAGGCYTTRFDSAGNQLWRHCYSEWDRSFLIQDLVADTAGNVYVTGGIADAFAASSGRGVEPQPNVSANFMTLKYDIHGALVWLREYDAAGYYDEALAIDIDSANNLYICGASSLDGIVPDFLTVKYDSAGNLKWARRYSGAREFVDYPRDIIVMKSDQVCVAGYSVEGMAGSDVTTLCYDTDGNFLWKKHYPGSSAFLEPASIGVDPSGAIIVLGDLGSYGYARCVTLKYSPCDCPYLADIEPDGFVTALDMAACIDILFAGAEDILDAGCPSPRFDFDCDGFSTALDLSAIIDHLFAGGAGPCDRCTT